MPDTDETIETETPALDAALNDEPVADDGDADEDEDEDEAA